MPWLTILLEGAMMPVTLGRTISLSELMEISLAALPIESRLPLQNQS